MSPGKTVLDLPDCGLGNMKLSSDIALFHACDDKKPDLLHLGFCQQCVVASLTKAVTPLLHHIGGIVLRGSKKQVAGIDAFAIVAPMANDKPLWNRANMNFVGKPMGDICAVAKPQPAISSVNHRALPFPTFVGVAGGEMLPKTIFDGCVDALVMVEQVLERLALYMTKLCVGTRGRRRFLSASAVAITVRDFVRGWFGGMLAHVKFLLLGLGRATGCYQQRRGVSIGCYRSILAQMGEAAKC